MILRADSTHLALLGTILVIAVALICPSYAAPTRCHVPTALERLSGHKGQVDIKPSRTPEPRPIAGPLCNDYWTWLTSFECWYTPCPRWIGEQPEDSSSVRDMESRVKRMLQAKVFGQTEAVELLAKAINLKTRDRPLSVHLVGDNGTGKTFTAKLLAEALFKNGVQDVLYLRGNAFIAQNEAMVLHFQSTLRKQINAKLKACPASLIIIDELQSMYRTTIKVFEDYLDTTFASDSYDRPNSTQAIFVFISDFGKEGMTMNDSPQELIERAYTESADIWQGKLSSLIQYIVPFMPRNYPGTFEYVNALTDRLFTNPVFARNQMQLVGINVCPEDSLLNGLSTFIWTETANGVYKQEQYRGIEKTWNQHVEHPLSSVISTFARKHDFGSIPKTDPLVPVILNICTKGGIDVAMSLEQPWCEDVKRMAKEEL